jgi:hypothetical protein
MSLRTQAEGVDADVRSLMSEMSWRTPVLSGLGATLVASVATIASTLLVGFNAFLAPLACGDDGPLDYGTGGDAVRSYCHVSFDDSGHFTRVFTSLSVLALALAGVTGVLLIMTRRHLWLYSSLTLLLLLGAWGLWLFIFA